MKRNEFSSRSQKTLEYSFKGLVAENGLVATGVSFPSGILALVHLAHNDSIYGYILFLFGLVVIAAIFYVVSGHSPHDLSVKRFRYHENSMPSLVRKHPYFKRLSGKPYLPFARIDAIRWGVYILNSSIIVWAFLSYIGQHVF